MNLFKLLLILVFVMFINSMDLIDPSVWNTDKNLNNVENQNTASD